MPVAEFNDVVVTPIQKLVMGTDMKGGPIWPNWEERSFERHCRNGKPMDTMPTLLGPPARMAVSPAFWGGFVTHHFGHQIADFLMRILPSRLIQPKAHVLFSAQGPEPRWFREVLDWMDVPASHVHIIREPAWLPRLAVVHQPEQLWNVGPSQDHLDALDRFIARKSPPLERITMPIYVSRAGLDLSHARFAGEAYLEHCLRQAGVYILRPETEPVEHQIRTYLAADHLIFSEGSSLHLLQLAGRSFRRVDVLGRRDWDMMKTWVRPRTRSYRHLSAARATIHGLTSSGENAHYNAISIPDMHLLIPYLAESGADIRPFFDATQFVRDAIADIVGWIACNTRQRKQANWRESDLQVAATLDQAQLTSLAEGVRQAIAFEG